MIKDTAKRTGIPIQQVGAVVQRITAVELRVDLNNIYISDRAADELAHLLTTVRMHLDGLGAAESAAE